MSATPPSKQKNIGWSMLRNSLALALFALLTAAILATTESITEPRIVAAERAAEQRALLELVPATMHDNDMLADTYPIPEQHWPLLGLNKGGVAHLASRDGKPVAVILPAVSKSGYSGDISMIIGLTPSGELLGVRVTSHRETPGLGDKVELKKSPWILSFNGQSLAKLARSEWTVKKDGGAFEQFTGATITPRAVIGQVLAGLDYFALERAALLAAAQPNALENRDE